MADFHFLRPWWLALLPVLAFLIWRSFRARHERGGWAAVIDPELRPHVLTTPELLRESRRPMLLGLAIATLALLALAGPTWERLPVPAFRSDEALVVALDLSRSMDAADLTPSRLARAKLKLLALLERREAGQTALVVFTTHAFTVTPLTTDTRTIASLVGALDSDIMPSQGSSIAAGLEKAGALLRQTGLSQGEILLMTDSEVTDADRALADDLRDEGYRVHVLAVGTEQGAPIAEADGGFLTDSNGQVVIPRVAPGDLDSLAAAGGGRFARLAPDDRDLDALFPPLAVLTGATLAQSDEEQQADVWRDQGSWLVVALLPLLALTFRRGWICAWAVGVLLSAPRADAFEWADLWQRRDQRGYEALQSDQAQRAAELFENPEWRGAAHYRAGAFSDSAASLEGLDTAEAHYNRGNALAKAGRLEPAIAEYDQALELDPAHEDARYNRDLLQEFLTQNPESQNQDSDGEQSGEQQQQANANGEQGTGEQGSEQQQQQSGDETQGEQSAQQSPGQGSDDQPADSDDSEGEQEENLANEQGEQTEGDVQGEPAPGPEDVEQWASEQAAEQWLRRIPQDPGGLLRRKFLYQYQRLGVDQEGNTVWPGETAKPW
jgi:Ca-activated chloride channel family protein